MNKAVFLDRDGVINPLIYNPLTSAYESPKVPEDFSVFTYTEKSLRLLKKHGFLRIVISNQPDYAKGKTTMDNILKIADILSEYSFEHEGLIDEFYYCYHHPYGIVPEYSIKCQCRKPGTLFIEQAIEKYALDRSRCIMVGDRISDMNCAKNAGIKALRIVSKNRQDSDISPDQVCFPDLREAVLWIINNDKETRF